MQWQSVVGVVWSKKNVWLLGVLGFVLACFCHGAAIAASDSKLSPPSNLNQHQTYEALNDRSVPEGLKQIPEKRSLMESPRLSIRYNYYPISGTTVEALNADMNQRAPLRDRTNTRSFAALTQWQIRWEYQSSEHPNGCQIKRPSVYVVVKTTLPQWQPSDSPPPSLIKEWERYLRALKDHEMGHQYNGIAAARDLQRWLELQETQQSCAQLAKDIDQVSRRMIAQYRQQDRDYDRLTSHGLTQGAILKRVTS